MQIYNPITVCLQVVLSSQIVSRDLEILEVIEEGLQDIQKKIQQHKGQYNVRLLGLQLNQIETVMGVLEDDRLDLCMSREVFRCIGVLNFSKISIIFLYQGLG